VQHQMEGRKRAELRGAGLSVAAPLDLSFVRSQFPSLDGDWAYFDNAGGSQTLRGVSAKIAEYLHSSMAASGGPYPASELGATRLRAAGERMATLVNAESADEIVLGSSSTQLLQNLGLALADGLESGDQIVLSHAEHHANVEPWHRLRARGIELREWKIDRTSWELRFEDLERLLTPRTKLVTFTQCSNILGSVHEVRPIVDELHARGIEVLVDGVAYAPHGCVDVRAWDVDYYVVSLYKVFGPHAALLYGKRDHLLRLPNVNHSFLPADMLPYKLQPGNANPELSHGCTAIVDYLEQLGGEAPDARASVVRAWEAIGEHEHDLSAQLLGFLRDWPAATIFGPPHAEPGRRSGIVSFDVAGHTPTQVAAHLASDRIGARAGDFYARGLAEDLGYAGAGLVRISLAHYNTRAEVDRVIESLQRLD